MRIPETPPPFADLMREVSPERFAEIAMLARSASGRAEYLHWDRLRRLPTPDGLTHREWWLTIKVARHDGLRAVALADATVANILEVLISFKIWSYTSFTLALAGSALISYFNTSGTPKSVLAVEGL